MAKILPHLIGPVAPHLLYHPDDPAVPPLELHLATPLDAAATAFAIDPRDVEYEQKFDAACLELRHLHHFHGDALRRTLALVLEFGVGPVQRQVNRLDSRRA